ncbi:hypothetical protein Lser_V15G18951 [Lactuca serriola]
MKHHSASMSLLASMKNDTYLESVISKRIQLFESIRAKQIKERQSIAGDPIKVTLPHESVKKGKKWETTPFDIAKEVSKSLASNALISQVDGVLWDMSRPLERDCRLKIFTFDSDEGRDTFWHSSAHILGQALEITYGCKLCIGPCTTRREGVSTMMVSMVTLGLNEQHFDQIVAGAKKVVGEKQPFQRIEASRDEALDMFSIMSLSIQDLPAEKTITVYRFGPLVDLCRGPHIPNTSFVKELPAIRLRQLTRGGTKIVKAYKESMGYLILTKNVLRQLGKKQELFFFHRLRVGTPNMYNMQLSETSGHAANYKENMFVFDIDKQEFGLKPMNCPGHCLMFDHRVRSYRELPIRFAEFGVLHRNEASGALTGFTRVRRFQQDDAHIFCRESQIKDEVKGVLEFINYVYDIFGFTFELKLSTRPKKYLGDVETWEKAETALADALNEFGKPWEINKADGAFYGPKIYISVLMP